MAGQRPWPPSAASSASPLLGEASSLCYSSQSSGALSQFSISRSAVVDCLLEKLVSSVSQLDPESSAFQTALQFCSFHTRSHQYLDVDDVQVGRLYDGLVARMEIASLPDKAARLASLVERAGVLLGKDNCRERGVEETTAPALLSVLFWVAGRPTAHRSAPLDDSPDSSTEPDGESSESSLSDSDAVHPLVEDGYLSTDASDEDWSQTEDGVSEDSESETAHRNAVGGEAEQVDDEVECPPLQLLMHESYSAYGMQEPPPLVRARKSHKQTRKGINLREFSQAIKDGRGELCHHIEPAKGVLVQREETVVMGSIILLKYGKRSSAFTLSPGRGWGVNQRISVTHLSPLCLHHALQVVTRTAAVLQQIREFCSRRAHTVDGKLCPVLVAIQSSVESILRQCNQPLDVMEAKCAHSLERNSVARVSLLELLETIQEECYYTTVQTLNGLATTLSQLQDGGLDCGSLTASTLNTIDAYEAAVENNELSSGLIRTISRQAVQVYSDAFLSLVRKVEIGDPHAQLPLSICSDSFGTKEKEKRADDPEEGVMFKVCPKSSWPKRLWPIKGEIVQTVATQTLVKIETAFQSCPASVPEHDEYETTSDTDAKEEQQSTPRESQLASGRDRLHGMDEFVSAMKIEIARAGIVLRDNLFRKWKFTEILEEIQAVYLFGAGDAMESFGALVFQWIAEHHLRKTIQPSSDSSTELDLTGLLASQFQDCGHRRAGHILQRAKIKLLSGVAEKPKCDGEDPCDDIWETMLYRMNLSYSIPFPISTIIDADDIQAYNGVWKFLLQLKWATMALDKCHQEFLFHGRERVKLRKVQSHNAGDELWRSVNVVTFRISHFVRALQEYLMTRVVLVEWNAFTSLISKGDSCTSLERAQQCHKSYLMNLQRQCLTALDKTWTVLALRLRTIIRLSFRLYKLSLALVAYSNEEEEAKEAGDAEVIRSQLRDIFIEFEDAHRFCIATLRSMLEMGQHPHLEILYDRIVGHNLYYTGASDRQESLIEI